MNVPVNVEWKEALPKTREECVQRMERIDAFLDDFTMPTSAPVERMRSDRR